MMDVKVNMTLTETGEKYSKAGNNEAKDFVSRCLVLLWQLPFYLGLEFLNPACFSMEVPGKK